MQFGNAVFTLQSAEQVTTSRNVGHRWKKPCVEDLNETYRYFFSASTNRLGIGTCICGKEGHFVFAKTMCFIPVCLVDEEKHWVFIMLWIHDLRLPNVDSKRVADYFKQSNEDITEFEVIMDSNIPYCFYYLPNTHVEFTRRQANEVVHQLARTFTSLTSFRIFDDVSICINDLIANEMQ